MFLGDFNMYPGVITGISNPLQRNVRVKYERPVEHVVKIPDATPRRFKTSMAVFSNTIYSKDELHEHLMEILLSYLNYPLNKYPGVGTITSEEIQHLTTEVFIPKNGKIPPRIWFDFVAPAYCVKHNTELSNPNPSSSSYLYIIYY